MGSKVSVPEAVWGEIFHPQTINCYVQSLSVNTDFCLQNSIEILCLTPKTRLFIINVSWTVFTQKLSFFYAAIRSHFYTRRLRTQLVDISISVIDLFFSLYYCDRFSFSSFYGFGFHSFNLSAIAEVLAGLYGIQFPVEVQMLLNCRKAANKLLYMLLPCYFFTTCTITDENTYQEEVYNLFT